MKIPDELLIHSVTVRPYKGTGAQGRVYGPAFPLSCMAQGQRRLVRNSDGAEVVSELTLYAAPGQSAAIPPGSEVDWRGDTTLVISAVDHDSGDLGAPDHTEVACE